MSKTEFKTLIYTFIFIIILCFILFLISCNNKPKEYKLTEYSERYAGITLYYYVVKSDSKTYYECSSNSPIIDFQGKQFDYMEIDTNRVNKEGVIVISSELRTREYESINQQLNLLNNY